MAIIEGKKILKPFIRKTAGYVKALLSAEHVGMKDGNTLQGAVDGIYDSIAFERYDSGIWHIRKYNNGDVECWCRYETTLTNYSVVLSEYGLFSVSLDLPFEFKETPIKVYTTQVGNGIAFPSTSSGNDSKTQICFYATANNTGSQTCVFNTHVFGRWK